MMSLRPTLVAAAAAALVGSAAHAQSITPQQFMEACRLNAANTVVLTQQTKFQTGFAGTTFATPTACTVILGPGASFELDTITMRFGGAFTVQAGQNGKVAIAKATLDAPSIALNLTGAEGEFQMDDARVFAAAGNLTLQFGEKGKMEVKNSGGWYQPRLAARRGAFNLSAGAFFAGSVVQSGLQGATGINFNFNGLDSSLKIESSDLLVSSGATSVAPFTYGAFQVSSSAAKVAFEAINVNLMEAARAVNIALSGAESKVGLVNVRSQTSSQRIAITAMGQNGEVKAENLLLYGIPEVIVETGVQGSTTVTNSPGSITATQLIRIRAGTGGACSASTQGLSSPTIELCR